MVTSLKNLKNEVDSRLAGGGLTDLACCQLQNADTILDNNIVTSVANLASLPDAELNEGRFVYVEDINEYRFSNQLWTDDVSSTVCTYRNQLWTWGNNRNTFGCGLGQLGDGTTSNSLSPVREFCSALDWCQVSTGCTQTAAIKTSGELWIWGCISRNLGDGTGQARCSPVREFCSATDWCQVNLGGYHALAIKTSGQLWAGGSNACGALGDGTLTNKCSPVREFCSATDWCQAIAGNTHSAAVKTSGELWAWGSNSCGELGDGTVTQRCSPVREISSSTDWCQVSAWRHSAAIKTSGELWSWGRNDCGQLGDGTAVAKCSPIREICSATNWCQVSASGRSTSALKNDGALWGWGNNQCGRLGDGTVTTRCSPVRELCFARDWCQVCSSSYHSMAIKTSGELWVWGSGVCGRLGDGTVTSRCSPVREFCSATDWCQVSAGHCHSAAINVLTKGFLE